MATFQELEDRVRYEIIAEKYEDQYLSVDIQDRLWDSSVEIAALFDFPSKVLNDATLALVPGDSSIAVPPPTMRKVLALSINGYEAEWAEMTRVYQERSVGQGALAVYNYSPRRGGAIEIGPATNYTGNAVLEYVDGLTKPIASALAATVAWDGLLLDWHWLIAYHAAIRLFQAAEREDEMAYWLRAYQSGMANLGLHLGRTDVVDYIVAGLGASVASQAQQPLQVPSQQGRQARGGSVG